MPEGSRATAFRAWAVGAATFLLASASALFALLLAPRPEYGLGLFASWGLAGALTGAVAGYATASIILGREAKGVGRIAGMCALAALVPVAILALSLWLAMALLPFVTLGAALAIPALAVRWARAVKGS